LSKPVDRHRIRPVRKLNTIIYGVFGILAMVYGFGALIRPQAIVPEAGQFPISHLVREQGALGVFLGLMSVWCIFNEDRRTAVHYFITLFAFLLATIHWLDFFNGHLSWKSPLYNSVPFLILLLMALVNRVAAKI
jgi:hypothetical protein